MSQQIDGMNENEYMANANRDWFVESARGAIETMERVVAEMKRDLGRPDTEMSPAKKVDALHRHMAWGVANATTDLSNAHGYANAVILYETRQKAENK